jgi:hypothetical protein
MDKTAWEQLLSVWAAEAVARSEAEAGPEPFSGLGFPGADETALLAAEARLGCRLPPSYRAFLTCTNGLRQPLAFVPAGGGHFRSAEEIDWFRVQNQDWIDAFTANSVVTPDDLYFVYGPDQDPVHLRCEYLEHALQISALGDSSVYLPNPKVVTAGGEWEGWFFANWAPGAHRYRSFAEMMRARREDFRVQEFAAGF